MRTFRKICHFLLGGGLYTALEWLYRGRSHPSMFLLGGSCFLMLGHLRQKKMPLPAKAALGAMLITAGELVTGLLVNRDHKVWDYRRQPMNFQGQICPAFSALWFFLSILGMWLYGWVDRQTKHRIG